MLSKMSFTITSRLVSFSSFSILSITDWVSTKSPLDKMTIEMLEIINNVAIIAVDLFGQTADYDQLNNIKDKYKINLLADSAQSFGAEWNEKKIGNLADITSTSFFPTKPLGCYGDGGAIFLNNEEFVFLV